MPNLRDEQGQTLGEYALVLLLIAIAALGVLALLGQSVTGLYPLSFP